MPRTKRSLRALAIGTTSFATASVLSLGSVQAEPEITPDDVDKAFRAAEVASEEVNRLTEQQASLESRIDELDKEIEGVRATYDEQRSELERAIVQQHLDSPLGPTADLLASKDAEVFLDGLSAVDALNTSRAESLDAFAATNRDLENREAQLKAHRKKLEAAVAEAEEQKAERDRQHEQAEADLAELSEPEQEEVTGGGGGQEPPGDLPPAKGNAAKAVQFAKEQLGDAYVYGGTGPDSWDCSGLVQGAWGAAGVSLPRVVGPQMEAGTSVPMSELQPGDIVAYPDMSHNGLYIGDGQVLHAGNPSTGVYISGLDGFSVASRVG